MVYQTYVKKKKRFDEEGDEVLPQKNRPFKLKNSSSGSTPKPPTPEQNPGLTDEEGSDKAYASDTNLHLDGDGTLFVSGTKGSLIGKEWLENYRDFGIPLVEKLGAAAALVEAGDMHGAYAVALNPTQFDVSQQDRYKQLDAFMKANPGKVKNMVGHSKGSAVIDNWIRNNPDWKGQSRLYSTPYDDPLGRERIKDWLNDSRKQRAELVKDMPWFIKAGNWLKDREQDAFEYLTGLDQVKGVHERGETRIANYGDFAAFLDNSADRYTHPDPWHYISGGGPHDYHTDIAKRMKGFGQNIMTPKMTIPFINTTTTIDDNQTISAS
jgi:hypothetical protein